MNGYAFVKAPGHPRAHPRSGRVREHILVMESVLGRHLLPGEEVHHKNADRADNRPENLELWNRSQPAGARVEDQVEWATQILARYAPDRLTTTP
ncbi:HNH endonuclease [Gordonia alkanivorans]|uniref:HNH endonuclease n=1 Tax=Gordonia alkanivorans TaxID=84096 RepID=UPI0009DA32A6